MKCNTNSYLLNYAWLALQMSEIRLVGTFGAWIESLILSKLGLAFWSALGRSRRKCTPIKTENQRFFFMKIKNLRFLIFLWLNLYFFFDLHKFFGFLWVVSTQLCFHLLQSAFFPGPISERLRIKRTFLYRNKKGGKMSLDSITEISDLVIQFVLYSFDHFLGFCWLFWDGCSWIFNFCSYFLFIAVI